jgi:hypothetical protein
MAQNNPEFNEINYGLLEDFNEENNTLTNESLYESALDTNNLAMNIENLRRDTEDISEQSDTALRRESTTSRKRKDNIMNTTIYKRKESENHNNKYVDAETMTSYLSITDLQEDAKDNVNILRSNLQKVNERDDILDDLDKKSQSLMEGSHKFYKRSNFLKNKMFWANLFNYLLIIFFIFLIVFLIIKLR